MYIAAMCLFKDNFKAHLLKGKHTQNNWILHITNVLIKNKYSICSNGMVHKIAEVHTS